MIDTRCSLGRLRGPRPRSGRALRRRGADDRDLLQAELPGAPPEAGSCRIFRYARRSARGGLSRLPALPPRRGRARPRGGGGGGAADRGGRGRRRASPSLLRRSAMRRTISSGCSRATSAFRPRLMRARSGRGEPKQHLEEDKSVTDVIYDSGYSAPSRFYAEARDRLGMTPSAWRDGGRGETINWTVSESPLGPMLVAATAKGICRLSFDEGEERASAPLSQRDAGGRRWRHGVTGRGRAGGGQTALGDARPAARHRRHRFPAGGVAGTAARSRRAKREAMPTSPRRSGKPGAVRAAGSANGANHVAVLIPCHRVVRSDGSLGGYAYGLERKRRLLDAEGHRDARRRCRSATSHRSHITRAKRGLRPARSFATPCPRGIDHE